MWFGCGWLLKMLNSSHSLSLLSGHTKRRDKREGVFEVAFVASTSYAGNGHVHLRM